MKKRIANENLMKLLGVVNCLAMVLVAHTANAACAWILGQPEEPEEAKSMRKF